MAKRTPEESSAPGGLNAFLDQGSAFEGKLTFTGIVRIDGRFSGDVMSEDVLHVGDTGQVEGTVQVGEASISGRVQGRVEVAGRVTFRATAVFEGELVAGSIVVEEGAQINGKIEMGRTAGHPRELERAVEDTLTGSEQAGQA